MLCLTCQPLPAGHTHSHQATAKRGGEKLFTREVFTSKNHSHCHLAIIAATTPPHSCLAPNLSSPTPHSSLALRASEHQEGNEGKPERKKKRENVSQRAGGGGRCVGGGEDVEEEQIQLASAGGGRPERLHREKAEIWTLEASVVHVTSPADLKPGARSPTPTASSPTVPTRRRPP